MQWMKHNLEIFGYNLIQLSFSDFVCNHNQTALKDLHAEQEVLFSKSLFCLGFLYETIAVTHQYWLLPSEVIYVMLSWNQLKVNVKLIHRHLPKVHTHYLMTKFMSSKADLWARKPKLTLAYHSEVWSASLFTMILPLHLFTWLFDLLPLFNMNI